MQLFWRQVLWWGYVYCLRCTSKVRGCSCRDIAELTEVSSRIPAYAVYSTIALIDVRRKSVILLVLLPCSEISSASSSGSIGSLGSWGSWNGSSFEGRLPFAALWELSSRSNFSGSNMGDSSRIAAEVRLRTFSSAVMLAFPRDFARSHTRGLRFGEIHDDRTRHHCESSSKRSDQAGSHVNTLRIIRQAA